MLVTYLFDEIINLKEKFKNFFTQKKKLYALDNYSSVVPFQHKAYLVLIKKCMNDGFLGETEAGFLCYMLQKYRVNFLDWSHKTPWLKAEMNRIATKYKEKTVLEVQTTFVDFDRFFQPKTGNVPVGLMNKNGNGIAKRI